MNKIVKLFFKRKEQKKSQREPYTDEKLVNALAGVGENLATEIVLEFMFLHGVWCIICYKLR